MFSKFFALGSVLVSTNAHYLRGSQNPGREYNTSTAVALYKPFVLPPPTCLPPAPTPWYLLATVRTNATNGTAVASATNATAA